MAEPASGPADAMATDRTAPGIVDGPKPTFLATQIDPY
jgi:hypothetical protein